VRALSLAAVVGTFVVAVNAMPTPEKRGPVEVLVCTESL